MSSDGWGGAAGSTSPAGSVGVLSCVCPKGTHLSMTEGAVVCEACPLNTYSSSAGLSCTLCPAGMMTSATGSDSVSDCQCPSSTQVLHAGECIQA